VGKTDIEDAFKKLDKLTHVEVLMATLQETYAHCRKQGDWNRCQVTGVDKRVNAIIEAQNVFLALPRLS
jgi:hypothetical protein